MKNQALYSSKDKSKKSKCRLLQFLLGTLRVKGDKVDCHIKGNLDDHSDIVFVLSQFGYMGTPPCFSAISTMKNNLYDFLFVFLHNAALPMFSFLWELTSVDKGGKK